MTDDAYKNEPLTPRLQDYLNDAAALQSLASLALDQKIAGQKLPKREKSLYTSTNDALVWEAIQETRKKVKLTTVEDYRANLVAPTFENHMALLDEEIKNSPLRIKRVNELAEILNTTESLPVFKQAFNEIHEVIYGHLDPLFSLRPVKTRGRGAKPAEPAS